MRQSPGDVVEPWLTGMVRDGSSAKAMRAVRVATATDRLPPFRCLRTCRRPESLEKELESNFELGRCRELGQGFSHLVRVVPLAYGFPA
jgi:hypothetical protein